MAWKGRESDDVDYKKLQTTLVNSKMQTENPPLYQTIQKLIAGAQLFKDGITNSIKKTDKIDLKNQVEGLLSPNNGGNYSGTYVPILTNGANVAASLSNLCYFIVYNRIIYVSGKIEVTPTSPSVLTTLDISLPIHSNFPSAANLHGIINGIPQGGATEGFAGLVIGNVSTGGGNAQFFPQNVDNHDCRFILTYERI